MSTVAATDFAPSEAEVICPERQESPRKTRPSEARRCVRGPATRENGEAQLEYYSQTSRVGWLVAASVAQESPDDVDAASGQGEDGLGAALALGALAIVEAPRLLATAEVQKTRWSLRLQRRGRRRLPLILPESRGAGATPPKPAKPARRSGLAKAAMSPPVAAGKVSTGRRW